MLAKMRLRSGVGVDVVCQAGDSFEATFANVAFVRPEKMFNESLKTFSSEWNL